MGDNWPCFTKGNTPAGSSFSSRHLERDFLCAAHGLPVAVSAHRVSPLEDGLLVLLALAEKRRMGHCFGGIATKGARRPGAPGIADGGCNRQSEFQDNRKRGPRGYDGAKQVKGRKRFGAGDTQGNLLEAIVVPANTGERAGAWQLMEKLKSSP